MTGKVETYLGRLCPKKHDFGAKKSKRYSSTGKCIQCRKITDERRNGKRKRGGFETISRSAENYLMTDDPKSPLDLLKGALKATPAIAAATAALTEKGRHDDAAAVVAAFGAVKAAVTLLEDGETPETP